MDRLRLVNIEQIATLLRTGLQLAGLLGAVGYFGAEAWAQISGALVLFGVTAYGVWARSDENLIKSASTVPVVEKVVVDTPGVSAVRDDSYPKVKSA